MKKALVIISALILIGIIFYGWNEKQADTALAEDSCDAVNHILSEQFNVDNVKCEKVEVYKKVSEDFYQGRAYLSTGKVADIGIKDKGSQILVTMSKIDAGI
ncbi:hypothetical protein [Cronobacter sakazakii]|uniref:hypothetical protein n=1 Tax=Cronobacter sakazakii TaxID=28141 RepID=UPI000948B53F|nr:hypothetical protein [Cronobacter sakazakii]PUX35953.1 hypothetical protein BS409_07715 [Cronobacter sakazakii]PUX55596.1 hypothetical protein BS418_03720 [Cronobacter sakazakii]PUX58607.1 hypothetical protein BS417_11265 [Cronobacter sakazakii]PUX61546.1 hypothetical protein BS416_12050 [Cronobacter sakazakii]